MITNLQQFKLLNEENDKKFLSTEDVKNLFHVQYHSDIWSRRCGIKPSLNVNEKELKDIIDYLNNDNIKGIDEMFQFIKLFKKHIKSIAFILHIWDITGWRENMYKKSFSVLFLLDDFVCEFIYDASDIIGWKFYIHNGLGTTTNNDYYNTELYKQVKNYTDNTNQGYDSFAKMNRAIANIPLSAGNQYK